MSMSASAVLNLLHRGKMLAVKIPARDSSHLAWIGVYPLEMSHETVRQFLRNHDQAVPLPNTKVYRIRRFEVDRLLIEQDVSLAEPHLENKINSFAYGDEDLKQKLEQDGIRLEHLDNPSTADYPI
jgi:hypothetical protein